MTMLEHFQGELFGEQTFSQEDSLASPSQQQESEKVETMNDISFRQCFELFQRSNRVGSSLKTFAACLVSNLDEYSPKLSHHWKAKATRSSLFVFLLQPSKPRIDEIDFGLLATPRTTPQVFSYLLTPSTVNIEPKEGRYEKRKAYRESIGRQYVPGGLAEQLAMLPTPVANDAKKLNVDQHGSLTRTITTLPTPTARDYKGSTKERMEQGNPKKALDCEIGMSPGLKLQPAFVEWMLGYPQGWTDLNHSETA